MAKGKGKNKKKGVEQGGGSDLVALNDRIVPHTGEEEHADLRKQVMTARASVDRSRWDLAAALYMVHDGGIYERWGYYSWEEYVDNEVNMTVRTTQYLTAIYHCFYVEVGEGMSADEKKAMIKAIGEIGWTKARALVGVVDKDNLKEWLEKAKTLSSAQLESEAKRALMEKNGESTENVQTMTNRAFRLAEEQVEILDRALELAKGIAESEKKGHLLSLICQDFVATNMAKKGGPGSDRMGRYLDRLGAMFGVRIVAVDKDSKKVVHGKKVFDGVKSG